MASLAREAATVAESQGVRLPFKDPVGAAEDVVRKTAANHSSMLQDVKRGAPTEIDSICGAVVREGTAERCPDARQLGGVESDSRGGGNR